ncbi:MAG: DHH family phosphoesterase [Clostridia bacterium]|nr:DHH family phosphoesterase [Clostridia bacterium]
MTSAPPSERYQKDELLSMICKAESVLLFSHVCPDGDTLGSMMALRRMLEKMGKRVVPILDGTVPAALSFLPGIDCLRSPRELAGQMDNKTPGTIAIAVDVSCESRLGEAEALFRGAPLTGQLDHHATNPGYARVNLIDSAVPATAILVARIQEALDIPVDQEEAICLYTALATDTGNFVYQNTTAEAFRLMSRLMEAGLPLATYGRMLFKRKERAFVSLLGKTLPTLVFLHSGEIAGLQVTCQEMQSAGATNEHTDGVVDYAIDTAGVKIAYFAREVEGGDTKISLRALPPYRVDRAAAFLGGGGHQLAAGCTVSLPLQEAVQLVQKLLAEAMEGDNIQ